ncbi:MAG TPA: hypothetical protein VK970_25395, partial [Candidatus Methylacidiphilales bacterium]|nr:hypothetical protein [Candidatus Methylacidiphilales bacterium]
KKCFAFLFSFLLVLAASIAPASAGDGSITSYRAYIGEKDLYASDGLRLKTPRDVLRQDRANYHKYGITQEGDTDDGYFTTPGRRERFENIPVRCSERVAAAIVEGGSTFGVTVYEDHIEVEFARR